MKPTQSDVVHIEDARLETVPASSIGKPRSPEIHRASRPIDLTNAASRFLGWWSRRREEESPWPAFDLFLREMLLDVVGAKRVRLFHVAEGGQSLRLLTDDVGTPSTLAAPTELMRHVISVGRRYIRGDQSHGPLVDQLASGSEEQANSTAATDKNVDRDGHALPPAKGPVVWMFPIRDHKAGASRNTNAPLHRSIGLVVVGGIDEASQADHEILDGIAALVTEFWLHVRDYECLQMVRRTDRGSGVLNRLDFLRMGEIAVADARREGEPVAVLAVAIEGLRRFDDEGWWSLRDRVIQEAGRILRRKLRTGDFVGRFSDDRFVILMRWLDLSLGRLIAARVISWIQEAVGEAVRQAQTEADPTSACHTASVSSGITVRCGLACDYRVSGHEEHLAWSDGGEGKGIREASLRGLLMGALSASAEARKKGEKLCLADMRANGAETDQPTAGITS